MTRFASRAVSSGVWVFITLYIAFAVVAANKRNLRYDVLLDHGIATRAQLGLFGSAYETAQGPAKVASGVLVDLVSPSWILVAATALTGVINVLFARAPGLSARLFLWGMNGVLQAFAWPSLTSIFMNWFRDSPRRGTLYAILSTSQNVGALICPAAVAVLVSWWGWEASFTAPGLLALLCAILIAGVISDTPPSDSEARPSCLTAATNVRRNFCSIIVPVVTSPVLWALAVSYAFNSLVRTAIVDWAPTTVRTLGYAGDGAPLELNFQQLGVLCAAAYEIGGAMGGLIAGAVSDFVFGGRRAPVMALSAVALAVLLGILACAFVSSEKFSDGAKGGPWLSPCAAFVQRVGASIWTRPFVTLPALYGGIGALAFVTHVLNGLVTRELAPPGAGSTAGGFNKSIAQLGAACAGYPVGVAVRWMGGWSPVLVVLAGAALLSGVLVLPLWSLRSVAQSDVPRPAHQPALPSDASLVKGKAE